MAGGRRGAGAPRVARTGLGVALLTASATFSLFLIGALIWGWSVFYAPGPSARSGGDSTIVVLPSGAGVSAIAANLKSAGVIRSTDMFKAATSLTGADRKLRAGEYEVPSGASLRSVLSLLVDGRVVRHFVTLPEGWSSAQAVDILMRQPILTGEVEVPPEGSLWPDTYEVSRGQTRASVIARMRRAHDENLAALWARRGPRSVVRTPEEAVILASIVEKETGIAAERPRVAAAFSNRLRQGMRLESDPTIIYGITQGRPLGRGLRRSEIDRPTAWNTYQIDGLPPTPIANPGRDAIAAVLNPPASNDIFFVADGTGGHVFAATYDQHLRNVARWRAIERQRAGLPPEIVAPPTGPPESTGGPQAPAMVVPPGAKVITVPQTPRP